MTKKTRRRFNRMLSLVLTLLMLALPLFSVFADGTTIPARVSGISDYEVYALKNKASGLYLTLPDYTEFTASENPIFYVQQYPKGNNDAYSRAVTITYSPSNGYYTIAGVIYENFGEGRITYNSDGDVYVTQNASEGYGQWQFVYNDQEGAYRILIPKDDPNETELALTAGVGVGEGSVYLTTEGSANRQFWVLEEITVNPHLVKATENLEKKNIGNGSEWLFKLRDSEMITRNILSVEAVSNPSLVTIARSGNRFVVKINEYDATPDDRTDNFSLIKITLDADEIRYVLVQDAGSYMISGCTSAPLSAVSEYRSISQGYNEEKELMLTFKSSVGNVTVTEWEIIDDFECVEIATRDGQQLIGTNYAVIKAKKGGFAVIKAKTTTNEIFSQVIEIIENNLPNKYVIEIGDVHTSTYSFEYQRFRNYLIKTENYYSSWGVVFDSLEYHPENLISCGHNYAVVTCDPQKPVVLSANSVLGNLTVTPTPAKGAIIIVPGVMGSQIYAGEEIKIRGYEFGILDIIEQTFNVGDRLWDPEAGTDDLGTIIESFSANEKIYALSMNANGTPKFQTYINAPIENQYNITDEDFQYGAQNIYRNLYNELYANYHDDYGYDIILYEYDWRYAPSDTAVLLDNYIKTKEYEDIIFVAHSMGGIVVSHYLTKPDNYRVNKNITVGTPYLGSTQLIYAYMTGRIIEQGGASLVGFYTAAKKVMSNYPAFYALLPPEDYFIQYLSYYVDGDINTETPVTTYEDTIEVLQSYMPNWNQNMFEEICGESAETTMSLFDENGNHSTEKVDSYYIVGSGGETISEVRLGLLEGETKFSQCGLIYTLWGDNTVTMRSATAAGTFSQDRIFYKINENGFKSGHVAMVEGQYENDDGELVGDGTTVDFICDIINRSHHNILKLDSDSLLTNYGIRYGE